MKTFQINKLLGNGLLPCEVVFHPSWWNKNAGITFDEDFFFHPIKRVEVERKMEKVLYERFGQYGLGADRDNDLPLVSAVHLAAGFLHSGMYGCEVKFFADAPPEVICANQGKLSFPGLDEVRKSIFFQKFEALCQSLRKKYGYLAGDTNWGGVLNTALDLRGQTIFLDMLDEPDAVKKYFSEIAIITEYLVKNLEKETGSSSIAVNRTVRHLKNPVFFHSECSVTMISEDQYKEFILPIDQAWSISSRPYGIHFCGRDPHRFASSFAQIPHLDFLDVGWGGDVKILREYFPRTFLNIRLSPVEIISQSPAEIRSTIERLVGSSGNPYLTGVCCINMDDKVTDEKVLTIFETIAKLRKKFSSIPQDATRRTACAREARNWTQSKERC